VQGRKAGIKASLATIVSVNPFRCRLWAGHERMEEGITERSCEAELNSIATQGQLTPVIARPATDGLDHDFEIVCGARRLFVARNLNIPLRAEIREFSDQEAAVALDAENRHRKDISPYERGLGYHRWLKAGYFASQDELARAVSVSSAQVSRMLKLAQLPAVIVDAFASPLEIRESWGVDLFDAWRDPMRRRIVAGRARTIGKRSPRPESAQVYEVLRAGLGSVGSARSSRRVEVVLDDDGRPLFRVKYNRTTVALVLPAERLHHDSLQRVKGAVAMVLQDENEQMSVSTIDLTRDNVESLDPSERSRLSHPLAAVEERSQLGRSDPG
jgi:ParB/RepB/Spo0J family partition protein